MVQKNEELTNGIKVFKINKNNISS